MPDSAAGKTSDYNTKIIKEFLANQGRVGGSWAGTRLILNHHIGARSGIERVTPVACSSQAEGRYAIWAANGGSRTHPAWYYNLKAHPEITVEVGTQTFTVLAQELDGTARAELWPKLVAEFPGQLDAAQARTTRQFPLFLLTPRTDPRREPGLHHAGLRGSRPTRVPPRAMRSTGIVARTRKGTVITDGSARRREPAPGAASTPNLPTAVDRLVSGTSDRKLIRLVRPRPLVTSLTSYASRSRNEGLPQGFTHGWQLDHRRQGNGCTH